MSRKAHADRSSWNTASIFAFTGGYGPFKPRGNEPIENVVVILKHNKKTVTDEENSQSGLCYSHPMHVLAGEVQNVLLKSSRSRLEESEHIFVVDLTSMVEDMDVALKREQSEPELTKGFGKTLLKVLERLRLRQVTMLAYQDCCPLLIKLARSLDRDVVSSIWLLHPLLPPTFVNQTLVGRQTGGRKHHVGRAPTLHLVFESELARDKRLSVIRHVYPEGTVQIIDVDVKAPLVASLTDFGNNNENDWEQERPTYDADYCNELGKSLFLCKVTVEMSKYTKQYERHAEDITANLLQRTFVSNDVKNCDDTATIDPSKIDWSVAERQVGALILRGNRCILVRSLKGEWNGMKLPSLIPKDESESYHDTAIRSVVHFTEADATEVTPLFDVPPVEIFTQKHDGKPTRILLHALYATGPPPDGPLEDADMEDDETLYDWYTFQNAISKLDARCIAGLQTMSLVLMERANLGLIPCKWGGVFGQELQLFLPGGQTAYNTTTTTVSNSSVNGEGTSHTVLKALTAVKEEWQPSRTGDVLQDVRKANESLMKKILQTDGTTRTKKKLPVTLLSGFLGSGKTTLLSHILTNYSGLKVAILVNDMGEINIDAAIVKNGTSIRQREEHMVEMSNGCICCTLREDLLIEVSKIASEGSFDYLLIESSGISEPMPVAETFSFEDSTGIKLGDIAEIDTLVTVVDASRFLSELDSLEYLRQRNWQADADDERNISHLLCDQVEFANVIILNKCDLLSSKIEKDKVKKLIQSMNPQARLLESTYSKVPLDSVLGTKLFSMSVAEQHPGWLQEARIGEHIPETLEYGIGSFTYRAYKPILPHRLHKALDAMIQRSSKPYDESIVLRAKGFIWFANCPQLQGDFSLAGNHYSILPGNVWWAEIDKVNWPMNLERDIAPLWREPYGDRQQEIVIIGQSLNKDAIIKCIDECLISDDDMMKGQDIWYTICNEMGDPYAEAWNEALDKAMISTHNTHEYSHEHDNHHEHDVLHDNASEHKQCSP